MFLGVDIGYGLVKATGNNSQVIFPSVVAPFTANLFGDVFKTKPEYEVVIKNLDGINEATKLVGEAALNSKLAKGLSQQEKPAFEHDLLLIMAVYLLSERETNIQADIGVGLPLSYYRFQKQALYERLKSIDVLVVVNEVEKRIRFNSIEIFPQGAGALLSYDKLPRGEYFGLIDIGTYTTDFFIIQIKNNVPFPIYEACGSIEIGMYQAEKILANYYESITGVPLPRSRYGEILQKAINNECLIDMNKPIFLNDIYKVAKRDLGDTLISHLQATWSEKTRMLNYTIMAGGGANIFETMFKSYFPNVFALPNPIFANAIGYRKLISA